MPDDVVIIDVESGDYEMDSNPALADYRLEQRRPGCYTFGVRVGYKAVYRFGSARITGRRRMLTGTVNDLQAWLTVEVLTIGGQYLSVEALLDTGFNGGLAMPISITRQLDLAPLSNRYTYLAVGRR